MSTEPRVQINLPEHKDVPAEIRRRIADQIYHAHRYTEPSSLALPSQEQWDSFVRSRLGSGKGDVAATAPSEVEALVQSRGARGDEIRAFATAFDGEFMRASERRRLETLQSAVTMRIPPIALPDTFHPPYHGGMQWINISGSGFTEQPRRLPPQPNGRDEIADPNSGLVGHNIVAEHDSGVFDFSDSATLNISRTSEVGVWYQVRTGGWFAIWAKATLQSGAHHCQGNVHLFGSGLLDQRNYLTIEIYNPSAPPVASIWRQASAFVLNNIDTTISQDVSLPQQVVTASPSVHIPAGSWIWLMVGTATQHIASCHHASLISSSLFTWRIDEVNVYS